MTKKVLVTFDDNEWKEIKKNVKFGHSDADMIRTLVMNSVNSSNEITKELATHEIMIATLAVELSSKGVISFSDWEQKVKDQVS